MCPVHQLVSGYNVFIQGKLFSHKKNEVPIYAANWMDLESIMPSERSQTQKPIYYMIPFM